MEFPWWNRHQISLRNENSQRKKINSLKSLRWEFSPFNSKIRYTNFRCFQFYRWKVYSNTWNRPKKFAHVLKYHSMHWNAWNNVLIRGFRKKWTTRLFLDPRASLPWIEVPVHIPRKLKLAHATKNNPHKFSFQRDCEMVNWLLQQRTREMWSADALWIQELEKCRACARLTGVVRSLPYCWLRVWMPQRDGGLPKVFPPMPFCNWRKSGAWKLVQIGNYIRAVVASRRSAHSSSLTSREKRRIYVGCFSSPSPFSSFSFLSSWHVQLQVSSFPQHPGNKSRSEF